MPQDNQKKTSDGADLGSTSQKDSGKIRNRSDRRNIERNQVVERLNSNEHRFDRERKHLKGNNHEGERSTEKIHGHARISIPEVEAIYDKERDKKSKASRHFNNPQAIPTVTESPRERRVLDLSKLNVKREETVEDIRIDIERLEKEIQFEIKQIKAVSLGL